MPVRKLRQAQDHDVEKTADHQPEHAGERNGNAWRRYEFEHLVQTA